MRRMLVIARLKMLELLSTLARRRHEASDFTATQNLGDESVIGADDE
jgi:hypothetical protein